MFKFLKNLFKKNQSNKLNQSNKVVKPIFIKKKETKQGPGCIEIGK
jgi:hypothetical protein